MPGPWLPSGRLGQSPAVVCVSALSQSLCGRGPGLCSAPVPRVGGLHMEPGPSVSCPPAQRAVCGFLILTLWKQHWADPPPGHALASGSPF